jgi:hypothetical protein
LRSFWCNSAEATIAEDAHHVAAARVLPDVIDDGIDRGQILGRFAGGFQFAHQTRGIEALISRHLFEARDLGDHNRIRIRESAREFALKNISSRRV